MEIFRKIKRKTRMITEPFFQSEDDLDPFMLSDDFEDQHNDLQELSEDDESPESRNHLLSRKEKSSLSAYLARYWHSTYFINRFAWWGIKYRSEVDTELLENNTSTRLFWLRGEGIPLENWSKIQRANTIKNFTDSTVFMLLEGGAIIMAPLLLHDWMSYGLFPEERCGASLPTILAGTATNQITWMNHFGSDVIHEAAYWTWLGVILIPPMLGLSSVFLRNKQLRILDTQIVRPNLLAALRNLDKESLTFKDACLSLWPMSRVSTILVQVKCMLLWDGRRDNDQKLLISLNFKLALVNSLIELTQSNYFLIRYRAMQLLAQVAASFHPENLDRFIHDPGHKAGLVQLRETILAALRKEPISEASTQQNLLQLEAACAQPLPFEEMENRTLLEDHQRGGLAHYFRWTLGEDSRPLSQLFWIPSLFVSTYTFYSASRYLELMIKKLIDIAYHFHDKSMCENKGNYFNFLTQSERYECVACDWPFVNYQTSFTAQACLQVLLQQSMSPIEILHHLTQLPAVPGITRIDFSQQDWLNWPVSVWEQILMTLPSMVTSPLELLNVSGPEENDARAEPSRQHIQALARLLSRINITRFDMSHQLLNDKLFNLLLEPLSESVIEELNWVGTNMTDVSATTLAHLISSDFQNLNNLQLADNQITDLGLQDISAALANSSLQIFNVANNRLTDESLKKLAQGIQQSSVHSLDLSGQSFSVNALRVFSETLKGNSSLNVLKLSNAGLTGDHITGLQTCLENLESLDVSDNSLVDQDVQFILKTNQHFLKSLNIARNQLGDAIDGLAEDLPATSLQHLDLSGNDLSQGFTCLAKALPHSQLLSLVCEDCELDDEAIVELTQVFSNHTLLRSLNLNNNKITDSTLMNWIAELPQTNLNELHLNNNEISNSNHSARLAQGLSQTNLTFLDLSSNLLDENFFNALAPILHQSQLRQLSLNDNKLEVTSLKNFAEALVQLPCHSHDLNTVQLSRQMNRVFYPMQPNTKLKQLDIVNAEPDSSTIRSFCRVASSLPDVHFLEPDRIQHLDWRTCEMLPTNTPPLVRLDRANLSQSNHSSPMRTSNLLLGSPFLISLLCAGGILCLIALVYGAYRASRSTYRFFRPAPPRLAQASAEFEEVVTDNNLRRSSP